MTTFLDFPDLRTTKQTTIGASSTVTGLQGVYQYGIDANLPVQQKRLCPVKRFELKPIDGQTNRYEAQMVNHIVEPGLKSSMSMNQDVTLTNGGHLRTKSMKFFNIDQTQNENGVKD